MEIRNSEFLTDEYLKLLASHGVAHVLNNWTRMPPIIEQITLAGVLTAPFAAARALLRPGRTYQQAVDMFQPYDTIKEENPAAPARTRGGRAALRRRRPHALRVRQQPRGRKFPENH